MHPPEAMVAFPVMLVLAEALPVVTLLVECALVPGLHRDLSPQHHLFVARYLPADSTPNRFNRSRGFDRSRDRFRLRSYGYRNCYGYGYGYGCGYGYGYGYPYLDGGVDPYWWWDSDSSGDQDQQDQMGLANEMNQQSLEEQQMRNQADQDAYAQYAPARPHSAETTEADQATVLIFRDQHKQEIHNYAIVGQTLWNFSPQHTQKIPLSSLDLPATEKANEDRGVDFHPPGANEGQ